MPENVKCHSNMLVYVMQCRLVLALERHRRVQKRWFQIFFCGKTTIKSESVRGQCKELDSENRQGIHLEECSVRKGYAQNSVLFLVSHKHRYGLRLQNFWLKL